MSILNFFLKLMVRFEFDNIVCIKDIKDIVFFGILGGCCFLIIMMEYLGLLFLIFSKEIG